MFKITGTLNDLPQEATYVLDGGVKIMSCKYDCGGFFIVSTRRESEPHHFQCAINASLENLRQMSAKSGPYYDKWLAVMNDPSYKLRWRAGMQIYLDTHPIF